MRLRYQFSIGLILIFTGLVLGYGPLLERKKNAEVQQPVTTITAAPPVAPTSATLPIEGTPVRIQIPSLNIDLPVINGYYNARDGSWTLTNTKAQYATITPKANNTQGNTFIYGHRLANVFGHLSQIKTGASVIITTDNNHAFTYVYRDSHETNPNDDSLFHYKGPSILTLQTCSGTWDQNRRLFTFDFKGVV